MLTLPPQSIKQISCIYLYIFTNSKIPKTGKVNPPHDIITYWSYQIFLLIGINKNMISNQILKQPLKIQNLGLLGFTWFFNKQRHNSKPIFNVERAKTYDYCEPVEA